MMFSLRLNESGGLSLESARFVGATQSQFWAWAVVASPTHPRKNLADCAIMAVFVVVTTRRRGLRLGQRTG